MRALRLLVKITLPLALVAAGVLGMRYLAASRPPPRKVVQEDRGPLVDAVTARAGSRRVRVRATGTVQPCRELGLTFQVGGRVVRVSPNLVAGGFFRQGEELLAIEAADYELAVARARAGLVQARYELVRTESQARVAREEWERLGLDSPPPNPLVLYEPQLENARAGVAAAEAAVARAELDLERTVIRAPLNGLVRTERVEVGQVVRAGEAVATVVGTDAAEVVVPLAAQDLRWLRVPRAGSGRQGSRAVVRLDAAGAPAEWTGRVVRALGEVDPRGRMTRVVVLVPDPCGLESGRAGPVLELGAFVDVVLDGPVLDRVVVLPRRAVRDGDTVWTVSGDGRLEVRRIEIARRQDDEVFVRSGVPEGSRVVVSALPGAVAGQRVRVAPGAGEDRP